MSGPILSEVINHKCEEFAHIVWTREMKRLAVLVGRAIQFSEPVLLVGETGFVHQTSSFSTHLHPPPPNSTLLHPPPPSSTLLHPPPPSSTQLHPPPPSTSVLTIGVARQPYANSCVVCRRGRCTPSTVTCTLKLQTSWEVSDPLDTAKRER